MEDTMYLLISFVLFVVWVVYTFWNSFDEDVHTESESHAITRYSIAEKIEKELHEK